MVSDVDSVRTSVDHDTRVAWLTLENAPKRNAITLTMVRQFKQALQALVDDDDVTVIILTGAGHDFTSGFDAGEAFDIYRQMPGGAVGRHVGQRARLYAHSSLWWGRDGIYEQVLRCPKVVILAAQGICYEAGLYLALCSDLVVAAESARFGNPRWRAMGADGDLSLLVASVGLKRANEMIFCGTELTADAALDWGLVDSVVPDAELTAAALDLGRKCATVLRDGIPFGKYHLGAALDGMHVGTGFSAAIMTGAKVSNLAHRDGEFNFLKERRDHGTREALRRARLHGDG